MIRVAIRAGSIRLVQTQQFLVTKHVREICVERIRKSFSNRGGKNLKSLRREAVVQRGVVHKESTTKRWRDG